VKFLILYSLIVLNCVDVASGKVGVYLAPYRIQGNISFAAFTVKVEKYLQDAKKQGAKLVVFPELISFDLLEDGDDASLPTRLKKSASYFPQYLSWLEKFAEQNNISILGGTFHRQVGNHTFNTAILVTPDKSTYLQDKIYLTPWESKLGWKSGEKLKVHKLAFATIVMATCYDVEFPQVSHLLASSQPEIILVPSQTDDIFGFQRVLRTSMARAVEHMSYVVHVGATSEQDARWHTYYGGGGVYTPQNNYFIGRELILKNNDPKGIFFELDLEILRLARAQPNEIYPARDQQNRKIPPTVGNK
jgi:predicted amidohydrolase